MSAGYSGTPLFKKLGLRPGMVCQALDPPKDYEELLTGLPEDVRFGHRSKETLDFVHLFVREAEGLQSRLATLRERIHPAGMIWVSWPKKASKRPTDITEDVIRSLALRIGLVDVKVCAVDDTWSGLKLVIRKERRRQRVLRLV
jgi:hypothetical protein